MSKLTHTKLEALRRTPPTKRLELQDSQSPGLAIRVTPKGTFTWTLQYRVAGAGGVTPRGHKAKGAARFRLTIGQYPATSLAEAREIASRYQAMAARGDHPHLKLEKEATTGSGTISAIAREYLAKHVDAANLKSASKIRYALETHVVPTWGTRSATSITRREVIALQEKMLIQKKRADGRKVGGPEAARTVRQVLNRMLEWACKRDLLTSNPISGVADPRKPVSRDRVLTMEEIQAVWKAGPLLEYPFGALYRLLLLTGCRRGEWANAQWSWIRIAEEELHIPAAAHKAKKNLIVPLSSLAMSEINNLYRWNGGDFVISGTSGRKPVSGFSRGKARLAKAVAEILGRPLENFRPHDFRRSVATHLRRLGVDRTVVKRVLGHAERDVTATYDRYDLLPETRAALELWARELVPPPARTHDAIASQRNLPSDRAIWSLEDLFFWDRVPSEKPAPKLPDISGQHDLDETEIIF